MKLYNLPKNLRNTILIACIISIFNLILFFNLAFGINPTGANVVLTKDDWVVFAIQKLEANGHIMPIFISSRPYERREIALILSNLRKAIESGNIILRPHEIKLLEKLEKEFIHDITPEGLSTRFLPAFEYTYSSHESKLVPSLWGSGSYHPIPELTLYEEIDVGRYRDIIGKDGKTASKRIDYWKWDYTADFSKAYICYSGKRFQVLFGRDFLFWGPGYSGSLILSDNSLAFDMILLGGKFGPIRATTFTAVLDKMWNEEKYRYLANRYLSGHRIDWLVTNKIELGLSEVILYGGDVRNIDFQLSNPLIPYYASQWNTGQDNNILVSADFSIRPVNGLKIYGQFLVDDFNYVPNAPNSLGYLGGIYLSDPWGSFGTDIRAEYARIDTWTYTHRVTENQFTHFGWLIGYPLGPDADQIFLEINRMIGMDFRLKLMYTFERKGSNTVADRFRDEDFKYMNFPSGKVERRHEIGLQLLWETTDGPRFNISWQRCFLRNDDKSGNNNSPFGELNIGFGYVFKLHI
ncbi:capsule assembly Wzi family protein [Candidatus Poribacteria bacterium]|nr:capsule assembly Wzi family protein [Candidatus Poribacteria bacterium]